MTPDDTFNALRRPTVPEMIRIWLATDHKSVYDYHRLVYDNGYTTDDWNKAYMKYQQDLGYTTISTALRLTDET